MKRFRLSTIMLLVIIAALGLALVVQQDRASPREAALQARLVRMGQERAIVAPFDGVVIEHYGYSKNQR